MLWYSVREENIPEVAVINGLVYKHMGSFVINFDQTRWYI